MQILRLFRHLQHSILSNLTKKTKFLSNLTAYLFTFYFFFFLIFQKINFFEFLHFLYFSSPYKWVVYLVILSNEMLTCCSWGLNSKIRSVSGSFSIVSGQLQWANESSRICHSRRR